ncbi:glycoside hydrolase family 6 protein [Cryptosporangium sp. NPDC048952]|uniref:glycoside hydrolase family 6 protein n=1 Tax=Cryptosporangium sp. NPDC048952 TaxID=3363961 RepID=UPI00371E6B7D
MRRYRIVLLATAVVVMLGAGVTTLLLRGGPEPERRSVAVPKLDGSLYDDGGQAAAWVRANPDDPNAGVIEEKIASVPQAVWITGGDDPAKAKTQVTRTVTAAGTAGEVPALVAYAIPDRDCGGAAAGGSPDGTAYRAWVDAVAAGLGPEPSIVVLEPDALAQIDCLNQAKRDERNELLTYAARTITEKAPKAQVYYDAGNSKWKPAAEMASRLAAAGANDYGSGISLNVSNFRPTGDEVGYGKRILDGLAVDGKKIVVDTSRNGAGAAADNEWCDPAGRKIGRTPTLDTGDEDVTAFLWVKRPGEADGCAANAGTFVPDLATALAEGA